MDLKLLNRVRTTRKARDLASDRRAGVYAKRKAYDLNLQFVRRKWPLLLSIVLVIPVVFGCGAVLLPSPLRGIIFGAGLASGPWMAWLVVVIFSGSTAMTVGASAEEWTASELRRHRRWRLVNGLSLKYEIDHIAVGAGGVLVVETKWSSQPWNEDDPTVRSRLEKAQHRLEENLLHLSLVYRQQLADARVYGLLVLWSAQPGAEPQREAGPGEISVIPAGRLRSWLAERAAIDAVSPAVQEKLVAALTRKIDELDRHRIGVGRPSRPSFERRIVLWVGEPFVAMTIGVYAAILASKGGVVALMAELFVAITLGAIVRRRKRLRLPGTALATTSGALAVAVVIATLIIATRS